MDALTIGIDEVGRGALAGPVLVGATALRERAEGRRIVRRIYERTGVLLRDSKLLSRLQREKLEPEIKRYFYWGVGQSEVFEIDRGLTQAIQYAADAALAQLLAHCDQDEVRVLADAGLYHSRELEIPTRREKQADNRYIEVAAASVIAKVARDKIMFARSQDYPEYAWQRNVGYGTMAHRIALEKYGLTPEHRRTFCRAFLPTENNRPIIESP